MRKCLLVQALTRFLLGSVLFGVLLFLPAGTLHYRNGWLLMGVLFVPMFFMGLILLRKAPALLEKRLRAKESRAEQTLVVKLSGLMFVLGFLLAGLDVRFGWTVLPGWVSVASAAVFLLAYLCYGEVLRENAYLSRTVEIQEGQQVIDTGLYAVVRHPMYSATLFLFLSMPLILGSAVSFAAFLPYPLILAKRIQSEEALLTEGLQGYAEYKERVKYRLIPLVW